MALINCPECNKEVSDSANSCPNCGFELKPKEPVPTVNAQQVINRNNPQPPRQKKHGCLFYVAMAFGVFMFLCVLIGIFGGGDTETQAPVASDNIVATEDAKETDKQNQKKEDTKDDKEVKETKEAKEEKKDTKKEEPKNEFKVGDVVETDNLKIAFLSAEEYKTENEFMQPKDGNKYIKAGFEFENIGKSDEVVTSWDFECYADGYAAEQTYFDEGTLDATLSTGKKTKGFIFFEVPKDAKTITFEYETNFWSEKKIIFIAE